MDQLTEQEDEPRRENLVLPAAVENEKREKEEDRVQNEPKIQHD